MYIESKNNIVPFGCRFLCHRQLNVTGLRILVEREKKSRRETHRIYYLFVSKLEAQGVFFFFFLFYHHRCRCCRRRPRFIFVVLCNVSLPIVLRLLYCIVAAALGRSVSRYG